MSTVRITKALITDVSKSLDHLFARERLPFTKKYDDAILRIARAVPLATIEQLCWGEHLHLAKQIPESWTSKLLSLTIRFVDSPKIEISIRMPHQGADIRVPPHASQYMNARLYNNHRVNAVLSLVEPLCDDAEYAALFAARAQLNEIYKRQDLTHSAVIAHLDSFGSLNKALIAYPELRNIVPSKYLAEVDTVVERKQRGKAVIDKGVDMPDTQIAVPSLQSLILTTIAAVNLQD